jgi:serum/glucocorticoid-regulated kinase 2
MVLEYMPGGELFYWLKKDKKFSEVRARLYTAEITLALEALHAANIVYRDLKPENILLDAEGHIKLTDFGLAKDNITGPGAEGGTKTFCGTPEYLAPEILENTGHGKAVDWWALGTLLYEMVAGLPPFYDNNVQRMYHKILHEPLRFPKPEQTSMSEPLKALVRGLLERKISGRTGSGPTDAQELKSSKFLSALNFERVMQRAERPEFKPPEMRSELDTRNFDAEFTREKAQDSLIEAPMSSTLEQKTQFAGFTYDGEK